MNIHENILRVKQLMGLNEQFRAKDPLEPFRLVDLGEREDLNKDYSSFGKKDGKLVGKSVKTNKWEFISPTYAKYDELLKLYELVYPEKVEEKGAEIDGVDRYGEPLKFKLGTLTPEDINKVYKYSLEYQKAFEEFRKTSPYKFCVGDLFDINLSDMNVDEVKKCGAPSFENILSSKFVDSRQKYNFVEAIYFLVSKPNDPKVPEIKKRLGITL